MSVTLVAYRHSVYSRIAKMALRELGVAYDWQELDPFAGPDGNPHPFGQVPLLCHDGFEIYETGAILRYLDLTFGGGRLSPAAPRAQARMVQVIAVLDGHGYWPLVRQIFSQRVFAPFQGRTPDEAVIAEGVARARPVLVELDRIAGEGLVLNRQSLTLADIHAAQMIGYAQLAPEGHALLDAAPALALWWDWVSELPCYQASRPEFR